MTLINKFKALTIYKIRIHCPYALQLLVTIFVAALVVVCKYLQSKRSYLTCIVIIGLLINNVLAFVAIIEGNWIKLQSWIVHHRNEIRRGDSLIMVPSLNIAMYQELFDHYTRADNYNAWEKPSFYASFLKYVPI